MLDNDQHNRAAASDPAIRNRDFGGSVFMPLLSGFSGVKKFEIVLI